MKHPTDPLPPHKSGILTLLLENFLFCLSTLCKQNQRKQQQQQQHENPKESAMLSLGTQIGGMKTISYTVPILLKLH